MWVAKAATLILLLTAGCTTPMAEPSPSGSPANPPATSTAAATPAAAPAVTIKKTGGFAGVDETLSVDAQGNWTRTTRTGTRSGKLSPEQLARLATLAADQRLATEATRPTSPSDCADAFLYTVTILSTRIAFADCGSQAPPATAALVRYLEEATAG